MLPSDERIHGVAPGTTLYTSSISTIVLRVQHLREDLGWRGVLVRSISVPWLTTQTSLGHVDTALVISAIAVDTGGGGEVIAHVSDAGPGAGGVTIDVDPGQVLALG